MEQNTLFGQEPPRPLAARLRPQCLEEYVGQTHLLGEGKLLRRLIETDQLASMIFWGPPGVGKTTMALAFSRALSLQYNRVQFTPDVMPSDITGFSIFNKAAGRMLRQLFLDEIH